jgi:poly-gamma-glutamate synthesis protein (capsule biosynthesis protein)
MTFRLAAVVGLFGFGGVAYAADPDVFTLNAVGDIAYPNGWGGVDEVDAKKVGLFDLVKPFLDEGDLNFANIECPMTDQSPKVKKTYPIACQPKRLQYVVDAGFNLFSLANNHALDAGVEGAADTRALLEQTSTKDHPLFWAGTAATSADTEKPLYFTIPGKKAKIAFFAVVYGDLGTVVASLESPTLDARIAEARKNADVVIVSVHNGLEYTHVPEASIVTRYHALIDAGASIVLGHHPHVVQGVERYKGAAIFYSLGNFSFGSHTVRHHETGARMYSMIGRVRFEKGQVTAVSVVPVYANNTEAWTLEGDTLQPIHCTPQPLQGKFASAVVDELQDFTAALPGGAPTRFALADGGLAAVTVSDVKIAVRNPDAVHARAMTQAAPPKKKHKKSSSSKN